MLLTTIGGLWLLWCAANAAALLLAPRLAGARFGAYTNGLQVVIPPAVAAVLTEAELTAVLAHEDGHRARRHALKNLARACCFLPRSAARHIRQEIEADDYAAEHADPLALASALRRLSTDRFDLYRAARLEQIAAART